MPLALMDFRPDHPINFAAYDSPWYEKVSYKAVLNCIPSISII